MYSSSVEQGSCSSLSDDKQREYQTLLREKEKREIQTLCLTEEVLREERALLSKYACRIFKNGSAKVVHNKEILLGDFKLKRT